MSRDEGEQPTKDEDLPWLREMVEDELLGLFSDDAGEVKRTTRLLARRAADDATITDELIEALRTSIERGNDDTEASVWMALLLGEIADLQALPVLFLGLGCGDEAIQEAAGDALLKIGPPAVAALLEEFDEEPSAEFADAGYRLLGAVGSFEDAELREKVMDFLLEQVPREAVKPPRDRRIESLFQASALLGDRRMLEPMTRLLQEVFRGRNAAILDAREMLQENEKGAPVVSDPLPWVESHRWLFEEDLESARVKRESNDEPPNSAAGDSEEDPSGEEDENRRSGPLGYYRGLNLVPPPSRVKSQDPAPDPP